MNIQIVQGPGNAAARIGLQPGESITTEGGAMIAMSSALHVETTTRKRDSGSIMGALKRLVTGESIFLNHYTAQGQFGEVFLAPTLPGDMLRHDLNGAPILVQAGSYVASTPSVDMDIRWQGFGKALFSGESSFLIELSGEGTVVLSSFGAIYPLEVNGEHIVDTGHIVAFESTLKYNVVKAGGSWMTAILGGEGLVCKFQGQGTVWCQSHNASSFGQALGPMLKPR